MAKKFGKFLLCTAAIGTAAAAAYYYFYKKDADLSMFPEDDEDYDDFSSDLEDDPDKASRNYVALNIESPTVADGSETSEDNSTEDSVPNAEAEPEADSIEAEADDFEFTPLAEQVEQVAAEPEPAEETVEEFFDDEDDDTEEESLIQGIE